MAYVKTTWTNREVEKPRTYTMTENADGTITLTPAEGTVFEAGTPIDAANMNKMEDQIAANDASITTLQTDVDNKLDLSGGTLTGPLFSGSTIDADQLSEAGTAIGSLYAPNVPYGKIYESTSGVYINLGTKNGNVYKLFLTENQPTAVAGERRAWIQVDQ